MPKPKIKWCINKIMKRKYKILYISPKEKYLKGNSIHNKIYDVRHEFNKIYSRHVLNRKKI